MKKILILLAVLTMVVIFTGCGTTKKVVDSSSSNNGGAKDAVQAISAAVDSTKITVNNNVFPNNDYVYSTNTYAAVPKALVEVYNNYPYTAASLLGKVTAGDDGTFIINIGNNDNVSHVMYVVQTEDAKRISNAVILTK